MPRLPPPPSANRPRRDEGTLTSFPGSLVQHPMLSLPLPKEDGKSPPGRETGKSRRAGGAPSSVQPPAQKKSSKPELASEISPQGEGREQGTKPRKVTQWAPPPRWPASTTRHRWGPLPSALEGVTGCYVQQKGATSLELRLHPRAVLGGGVDGRAAAGAGHLLPCFLVTGLGGLKVHSLSRQEMLDG